MKCLYNLLAVKWEMTPVEMTMVPRFYLEMKKRLPIEFIPPLQDIYDFYKASRV